MVKVKRLPKDKGLDHTLDLLKEGYLFIGNRTYRYQTDLFQTRLMGKKVICMTGVDAAKVFYHPRFFERKHVMPNRIKATLTGKDGVQGLDGAAHRDRKALFIHFTDEERTKELIKIATKTWEEAIKEWPNKDEVILMVESKEILCKAACKWLGIPLPEKQVQETAKALGETIFGFGKVGIRHWKGRISRNRLECWLKQIVEEIREEKIKVKHDTILYEISHYTDETGELLEPQIVAVEILNLLRPTVAVAVYITFMALALYENPAYKVKLALGNEEDRERFNEEVRRYYPFAPFVGAKVRRNFIWRNYAFKKGTLVLLDLYGTNHDERLWHEPYTFNPERYKKEKKNHYNFMPQGGGSLKGHRCAGEQITMAMMNIALDVLVNKVSYELPPQDLSYSLIDIPTLPVSGVVMSHIKRIKDK